MRSTQRVLVTSRSLLNSAHFCHSLRPPFLSCATLSVAFSFSPITLPLCWVLVPQRPAHHHPVIPSSPDILSEGLLAKYVFLSFPNEAEAGPFPERRGSQSRRKECQRMRVQVLWEVRKEPANSDEGSPKITLKNNSPPAAPERLLPCDTGDSLLIYIKWKSLVNALQY